MMCQNVVWVCWEDMNSYHQVTASKELQKIAKTLRECTRIREYYDDRYYLEYRS